MKLLSTCSKVLASAWTTYSKPILYFVCYLYVCSKFCWHAVYKYWMNVLLIRVCFLCYLAWSPGYGWCMKCQYMNIGLNTYLRIGRSISIIFIVLMKSKSCSVSQISKTWWAELHETVSIFLLSNSSVCDIMSDPCTDCINENCYDRRSTLFCIGVLTVTILVGGIFIGLIIAPFLFGFTALPRYQIYMDEEQYHVKTMCSNIAINNRGKQSACKYPSRHQCEECQE